jgi:hypothetical protein
LSCHATVRADGTATFGNSHTNELLIMSTKLLIATGLSLAFAASAMAQNAAPTQPPSSSAKSSEQQSSTTAGPKTTAMQQIKQDLETAGFKDVQIMPESFLVRARDKEGRPVMMVINPDSVTSVTQMSAAGQHKPDASGSGTGAGTAKQ